MYQISNSMSLTLPVFPVSVEFQILVTSQRLFTGYPDTQASVKFDFSQSCRLFPVFETSKGFDISLTFPGPCSDPALLYFEATVYSLLDH